MADRPFRFAAPMPRLDHSSSRWRDEVRQIEDLGFSTVSISDHFTQGWKMEPVVAMTAAAVATERLRVASLVFGNDYRHPVMLHKAMATLDVLSSGRLEIGLGAGWMASDYTAAGFPYDPVGVRLERLEESIVVLKGLFGPDPLTLDGKHYQIHELDGLPKPVQEPHPPLLIGGGSKRILKIAAHHADIIGINATQRPGVPAVQGVLDQTGARVAEKVEWVKQAAADVGRSPQAIELQMRLLSAHVTRFGRGAASSLARLAADLSVDPSELKQSPALLYGSVEQCVEALEERRERFGFNYWSLTASLEDAAPIVARLAGT